VLGWKPYDYYMASPYEYFCAVEGYFDKLEHHVSAIRLSTFFMLKAQGAKIKKPKDFWPMFTDEKPSNEKWVITPEMYEQILKKNKVK